VPASTGPALEMLRELLRHSDAPASLARSLADQVRERSGAGSVLVVQHAPDDGRPTRLLATSPQELHAQVAGQVAHGEWDPAAQAARANPGDPGHPQGKPGPKVLAGRTFSWALPLRAGSELEASLLLVELPLTPPDQDLVEALQALSESVAIILRNALRLESRNLALEDRTRTLEKVNQELQTREVMSRELLHTAEISRRALLDILEDHQLARKSLSESEARFRTAIESAPEAIFIQTAERFAYVNAAALRLFGATDPSQLLGRRVVEFFHPDFRGRVQERIRTLNEHRSEVPAVDEVCIALDQTIRHINVSAVPFEFAGKPGALVFARDITERKQAGGRPGGGETPRTPAMA